MSGMLNICMQSYMHASVSVYMHMRAFLHGLLAIHESTKRAKEFLNS